MTDFRITETGRYKLRNGDVVEVTGIDHTDSYAWDLENDYAWSLEGRAGRFGSSSRDIVEKLPEEDVRAKALSDLAKADADLLDLPLAPQPAPEKQEANVWDEYMDNNNDFDAGPIFYVGQNDVTIVDVANQIDALHAWKNHILSLSEGSK